MTVWHFSGVVHPERTGVNFQGIPPFDFVDADGSLLFTIVFDISYNQVTAIVDSETNDLPTLRNIVFSCIQSFLDLLGFTNGCYYELELTKAHTENGEIFVFGVDIPYLSKRTVVSGVTASKVLSLLRDEEGVYIRRCLRDLASAMKYADDTPFYCFRAIETLKQYVGRSIEGKPGSDRDKKQWQELTRYTGYAPNPEFDWLTKLNLSIRHGKPTPVTDADRINAFKVAWDIVEAYITRRSEETIDESSYCDDK